MTKDRLGKGLGALLGEYLDPAPAAGEVRRIPLEAISANPLQPRRRFTDAELEELIASIRENGLLQPLVVRGTPGARDRFQLVAGERRLRALSRLGWADVPVLVREVDDETLLVLALVENLQRESLNPLEEAEAYERLGRRFGLKHAEIAKAVGKDRSTVANLVRLLQLPPSVRSLLEEGRLSSGHARALLTVGDARHASELARRAADEGWSVREIERRAAGARPSTRRAKAKDPVLRALKEALQDELGTRVEIRARGGDKGSIEITYHGREDFERLFERIAGRSVAEIVE